MLKQQHKDIPIFNPESAQLSTYINNVAKWKYEYQNIDDDDLESVNDSNIDDDDLESVDGSNVNDDNARDDNNMYSNESDREISSMEND
ncbi:unnamed protein product [Didymodactylos carnosus]|uniref:Uncharacterized protein n=2 Tax=Didymodactylos carnosus TaxID=1234261 RepID=A0A814SA57_9BILA|nr:unnamed protein product [Didymodactylos carnosus]CAF3908897.1 unnamed protein product [Didymodactylos carnosus]